jgi:hypothetical protein
VKPCLLEDIIDLDQERRAEEEVLRLINEDYSKASEALVAEFVKTGIQSMKVRGLVIYLEKQVWVTVLETGFGLADPNFDDCAQLSTKKIANLIREGGEEKFYAEHPVLRGMIRVEYKSKIKVKKG